LLIALSGGQQASPLVASAQFFLVLLFTTRRCYPAQLQLHVHLFAASRGSGFLSTTHLRRPFLAHARLLLLASF
jgi:hypothetical protein